MRKFIALLTIIAFNAAYFPSLASAAEAKKPILVVFDLEMKAGVSAEMKDPLSSKLREAIFMTGRYEVVDKNNMNNILAQQGEQAKECYTQECAIEMGRMLTAQKIVTGSVSKIGKSFNVSIQVSNLETGLMEKIISEHCKQCEPEDLLEFISTMATKIVGGAAGTEKKEAAPEPQGTIVIDSNVKGADVKLDNALVGTTPLAEPLKVKPGSHSVIVMKDGYSEWKRDVKVDADKKVSVQVNLVALKAAAPKPGSPAAPAAAAQGDEEITGKWWFWTAIGVVVVGAGAGAAMAMSGGGGGGGGGGSGAEGSVTATW